MRPILPVPMTPAVLPWRSKPSSPASEKLCSRTRPKARWSLRFKARISATVCSATEYGE